jgi:hypothetical protein
MLLPCCQNNKKEEFDLNGRRSFSCNIAFSSLYISSYRLVDTFPPRHCQDDSANSYIFWTRYTTLSGRGQPDLPRFSKQTRLIRVWRRGDVSPLLRPGANPCAAELFARLADKQLASEWTARISARSQLGGAFLII